MSVAHEPAVAFEPLAIGNVQFPERSDELRERHRVVWSTARWSAERSGFWLLSGYDEVHTAMTQAEDFVTGEGTCPFQFDLDIVRLIPLELGEPLHKQIRLLLQPFFTPTAINALEQDVARLVEETLDECMAQSPCDMAASFARVLPVRAFFELFLHQDPKELGHIFELIFINQTEPERAAEASPGIFAWCAQMLEAARDEQRRDDLVGTIAHMGLEPGGEFELTETQRLQAMYLFVVAGIETTQAALGSIFYRLGTDQDLRQRIAAMDDDELANAVEELLRYTTVVPLTARTLASDVEMAGCPMAKGERVNVNFAAANRDPAMFTDPTAIDLARPNARRHLAFGAGLHTCLGNNLARRELRLSLRAVARLARFEVAEDFSPSYMDGFTRGPMELPVYIER